MKLNDIIKNTYKDAEGVFIIKCEQGLDCQYNLRMLTSKGIIKVGDRYRFLLCGELEEIRKW